MYSTVSALKICHSLCGRKFVIWSHWSWNGETRQRCRIFRIFSRNIRALSQGAFLAEIATLEIDRANSIPRLPRLQELQQSETNSTVTQDNRRWAVFPSRNQWFLRIPQQTLLQLCIVQEVMAYCGKYVLY